AAEREPARGVGRRTLEHRHESPRALLPPPASLAGLRDQREPARARDVAARADAGDDPRVDRPRGSGRPGGRTGGDARREPAPAAPHARADRPPRRTDAHRRPAAPRPAVRRARRLGGRRTRPDLQPDARPARVRASRERPPCPAGAGSGAAAHRERPPRRGGSGADGRAVAAGRRRDEGGGAPGARRGAADRARAATGDARAAGARECAHRARAPVRRPERDPRRAAVRRRAARAVRGGGARGLPGRPGGPDERRTPRVRDARRADPRAGCRERRPPPRRRRLGNRGSGGARRPRRVARDARACAAGRRRARGQERRRGRRRGPARGAGGRRLMPIPLVTRILVADDHPIVRSGLRRVLDAEPDLAVVAEAEDGAEAVRKALAEDVHLAILDVSMPKTTGIQAAAELHRRRPELRLLMLSMYDSEQFLFESLRAGASGYVLKSEADHDIVDAVRRTMRGQSFLYPSAVSTLVKDFVERGRPGDEQFDVLTPRELQVLKLIAEANTSKEIAQELVISVKTVERHRQNILDKLGMSDRVELTRYAIRRG